MDIGKSPRHLSTYAGMSKVWERVGSWSFPHPMFSPFTYNLELWSGN